MSESKEYIITVASGLFLRKSYKEVTMKELVNKTGLSKGAVYHYFESKEQLFLEVLDFFFTNVMAHRYEKYSRESFFRFYHDYADEVKEYSEKYLGEFKNNETASDFNMNYFTLAFDGLKLFPEFRKKIKAGLKAELDIWTEVIRSAREKGEIKSPMTDEQLAKTFIYLSDGVAMHEIMTGTEMKEMVNPFLSLWDKLYEQIKA